MKIIDSKRRKILSNKEIITKLASRREHEKKIIEKERERETKRE